MLYTAKEAQEINPTGWKEFQMINDRLSELSEFLGCSVWVEEEFDSMTQVGTTLQVRIATQEEKKDSLSKFLAQVQKIKNIDHRRSAFLAAKRKHMQVLYVVKTW